MIAQNRGEWSELYVFLKLLGDGVLYAADSELNKKTDLYYPVIEILRRENNVQKHYVNDDTKIKIVDDFGGVILTVSSSEFDEKAKLLLDTIKSSDSTFSIPQIEEFMQIIKCSKVKADSMNKSDITLVLHDCKTYKNETFGFSIKSKLGAPSTLLNAGKSTNFIYEIEGNIDDKQIEEINAISSKSKLRDRLAKIKESNCELKFCGLQNRVFNANLQMIDSQFPLIISEFLLQYYWGKGNLIFDLTPKVRVINPCNFDINLKHLYYEHKMKNFLTDVALGMTSATLWEGTYQTNGGYIIVREDGEVLCYHVYNHNEFQEYLFKNTRLETPSTSKYDFGFIYKENGKMYIKLNLQVRFI